MQVVYVRTQALDAGYSYIDLGPEALMIQRCFSPRPDVDVHDVIGNVTTLRQALSSATRLPVLHISSHGSCRGIILESSHGEPSEVLTAEQLVSFFSHRTPELLVLAACQSATLARDVATLGRVPHVIATCVLRTLEGDKPSQRFLTHL